MFLCLVRGFAAMANEHVMIEEVQQSMEMGQFAPSKQTILNVRIRETYLPQKVKTEILSQLFIGVGNYLVADLAKLPPETVFKLKPYTFGKVESLLRQAKLRMGLSDAEISHYIETGRLPPPTLDADVYALGLRYRTARSLYQGGIHSIADLAALTLSEFRSLDGLDSVSREEVARSLLASGFRFHEMSPQAKVDGASKQNQGLPLSEPVLGGLRAMGIENWEGLRKMDVKTLKFTPRVGPGAMMEIRFLFENNGQQLFETALERAVHAGGGLDLNQAICRAANVTPQLQSYLRWHGLVRLRDLLDAKAVMALCQRLPRDPRKELTNLVESVKTVVEGACVEELL